MRIQKVKRVLDLRASQQRVNFILECGHSIFMDDTIHEDLLTVPALICDRCPDLTPLEIRGEKSPQQLWKEAGEP